MNDPNHPYGVVYDTKPSPSIQEWKEFKFTQTYPDYVEALDDYKKYPKVVFTPSFAESQDAQSQDQFFRDIYLRCNTRLYIDEAYSVLGGTNPSFHLQAILSRGGEKGISCLIAAQRPRRIPLLFKSEVEHMYIFSLNLVEDKITVAHMTDIDPLDIPTENHKFIYYNCLTGKRSPILKLNLSGLTTKAA